MSAISLAVDLTCAITVLGFSFRIILTDLEYSNLNSIHSINMSDMNVFKRHGGPVKQLPLFGLLGSALSIDAQGNINVTNTVGEVSPVQNQLRALFGRGVRFAKMSSSSEPGLLSTSGVLYLWSDLGKNPKLDTKFSGVVQVAWLHTATYTLLRNGNVLRIFRRYETDNDDDTGTLEVLEFDQDVVRMENTNYEVTLYKKDNTVVTYSL